MRLVIATFALIFAMAGLGLALDNINGMPYKVTDRFYHNTYVVSSEIGVDNRPGLGTGVWIDKYHILTNCHVIEGFDQYTPNGMIHVPLFVINYDGKHVFRTNPIACDNERDLGLLKSEWPNHDIKEMKIDWRQPRFGSILYSAGYHLNLPLSPKVGYMGSLMVVDGKIRAGITMPIAQGDSGSPVLDKWGALVGIVSAVYARRTFSGEVVPIASIAIAVPAISINTFLEKHLEGYNE